MESKQQQEKLMILQTAIKQLIDEEKKSYKDVLVTDVDKEFDHRLLSKLLSQVETLREDDLLQEDTKACNDNENAGRTEEVVQPEKKKAVAVAVIKEKEEEEEESSDSSSSNNEERREEEIINELRKVKRQNLITHCLLSVMFVLTVTWQLSEVSMILKVKEGLNHPIRSFGGMLTRILKKPVSAGNGNENDKQHGKNRVIETSVPGISIPEVDLPSLDFDRE